MTPLTAEPLRIPTLPQPSSYETARPFLEGSASNDGSDSTVAPGRVGVLTKTGLVMVCVGTDADL